MSELTDFVQRAAKVFPGGVLGGHRSGPGLEYKIYVSLAHTDADIDETLGVFDDVLGLIAQEAAR